jgi:hypothetical protein
MENVKNLTTTINDLKGKQPAWSEKLQKYVIPLLDIVYIDFYGETAEIIESAATTTASIIVEITTAATETENVAKGVAGNQGLELALGGRDVMKAILEFTKSE